MLHFKFATYFSTSSKNKYFCRSSGEIAYEIYNGLTAYVLEVICIWEKGLYSYNDPNL